MAEPGSVSTVTAEPENIQKGRRSRPFSLPRGDCQYPGCTATDITARHYGAAHEIHPEQILTYRSDSGYVRCKIASCSTPRIPGNFHDTIKHILAKHPAVIHGEQEPIALSTDWQAELEQIAQNGIRLVNSAEASIHQVQAWATQQMQDMLSRIRFLEQQLRLAADRIEELEAQNSGLSAQYSTAHSVIVEMRARARELDTLEKIYKDYMGKGNS